MVVSLPADGVTAGTPVALIVPRLTAMFAPGMDASPSVRSRRSGYAVQSSPFNTAGVALRLADVGPQIRAVTLQLLPDFSTSVTFVVAGVPPGSVVWSVPLVFTFRLGKNGAAAVSVREPLALVVNVITLLLA